jgi:recombination protein RecT
MNSQTQDKPLASRAKKRELREVLQSEDFRRRVTEVLPRTMSPERFTRIAYQATFRIPELLNCTQDSFLNSLMQLGTMGLEPDGRRAHLIPFRNKDGSVECTLIVDYKGIKELVRRNGDVSSMHGDVVGENDSFEVRYGTRGVLDHVPNLHGRGKIYCAYSWVKLPNGDEEYDVMTLDEIEVIRNRSKTPNKGPWVTDWNEMAKKTVFRRHAKALPLSPDTREALERESDGDALTDQERFQAAAPAKANVLGLSRAQRGTQPAPDEDEGGPASAQIAPPGPQPQAFSPPAAMSQAPSAEAPPASLQAQVQKKLVEAGFSVAELLALMKPLRLAPKEAQSLDDVSDSHLGRVLEDWETCKERLSQEKEARLEP